MSKRSIGVVAVLGAAVVGIGSWLLFSGPSAEAPVTINCDTIRADLDAVLARVAPERKVTVSGLACTGQGLSIAELRLMPGTVSTEASTVTLSNLGFTALDVDKVKQFVGLLPDAEARKPAEAKLLLAGEVTAGRIQVEDDFGSFGLEALQISDLGARHTGLQGADLLKVLAFSKATMSKISIDPASDLLATASYHSATATDFNGETVGSIEVMGMASAAPDGSMRMSCDRAVYRGVSIGSLGYLAGILENVPKPMPQDPAADPRPAMQELAIWLDQISGDIAVDHASGETCAMAGRNPEMPNMTMEGKFARWSVDRQFGLAVGSMVYEGMDFMLKFAGEEVGVSMARGVIGGVDMNGLFAPWADGSSLVPDLAKFRLETYEITDLAVTRQGRPPLKLASFAVKGQDYVNNIASSGTFVLSGLEIPAAMFDVPEVKEVFAELGYDALKLGLDASYTYDHKSRTLDVKRIQVAIPDGGTLSLAFRFTDYDIAALYESLSAMQPPIALAGSKLDGLSISYEDKSLLARIMKVVARREGTTPEDLQARVQEEIANEALRAPGPLTKAAVMELARFLQDPGNITVSLVPVRTATFAEIGGRIEDVEGLAKLLGLSVKVNQTP